MSLKNKKVEQLSGYAAMVYAVNQLLLMGVIIVGGFILFEFRTGVKEAKYDNELIKSTIELPKLIDNKDHEVYTLLVNELPEKKELRLLTIMKYDKSKKSMQLLTLSPNMKMINEGETLATIYHKEGLGKLIDEVDNSLKIKLEHTMIVTPYAAQVITDVFTPKKMTNTEWTSLAATTFSEDSKVASQALDVLVRKMVDEGFSKKNVLKLPKLLGVLSGYTENDFNTKQISSLAKNLLMDEQVINLSYFGNEKKPISSQSELLNFLE